MKKVIHIVPFVLRRKGNESENIGENKTILNWSEAKDRIMDFVTLVEIRLTGTEGFAKSVLK